MDRGDIYKVDLNPIEGREQEGYRPVFIITSAAFNKHNPPLICPIATAAVGQRMAGFTVSLHGCGTGTTGVVLCSGIRALDLRARKARRVEKAPDKIVAEVMDCVRDILE